MHNIYNNWKKELRAKICATFVVSCEDLGHLMSNVPRREIINSDAGVQALSTVALD
jgi:hypothetical protein